MASPNIWTSALGSAGPTFATLAGQYVSGTIYWVDSASGNDSNNGTDPWKPKKSWTSAVAAAGNNDTIVLAPGHAETLGNVASISNSITTIGLGSGSQAPQLTPGTSTALAFTATMTRFFNVTFKPSLNAATPAKLAFTNAGVLLDSCTLQGGWDDASCVSVNGGTARIISCSFSVASGAAGFPTYGLFVQGAGTDHSIIDTTFDGGSTGWIGAYFSSATTRLDVRNVTLLNKSKFWIVTTGSTYNLYGLRAGDSTPCPIVIAA